VLLSRSGPPPDTGPSAGPRSRVRPGSGQPHGRAVQFYFDLGSPYAYLAAERVSGLFAEAGLEQPEWQPVLLGGLFKRFGRDSWANGPQRADGMAEIERRAAARGLPPLRWPEPWPGNTLLAMRAATFAKQTGRAVSFALAAFRQAFAAGRDLGDPDSVLIAAAATELHPRAVTRAVASEGVKGALREATDRAGDLGVRGVPSLLVGERVYWGDDQLEEAVRAAAVIQP
jgi:2-hydroxychromene-2-carboxylate isomerase